MPFVADRRLEDMLDEDAAPRCARRIARDGLDRLVDNTKRNTPVDTSPFRDKPGRPRGALRDSIHGTDIDRSRTPLGDVYEGRCRTFDPVGPNVEWTTAPHIIRPRAPGYPLHWRDGQTGDDRFAYEVHHPGTRGQHMFAIGAAITERELDSIARPALNVFEHDLVPSRTGRVFGLERFG